MKLLLHIALVLLMSMQMQAQQKTITGTVTAKSDGLPLPGVNVIIKGTTMGVQTNFDGIYTISCSKRDILIFSFLGLKTKQVEVEDDSVIDVSLEEDPATLEEVAVVGYSGSATSSSSSYSVRSVSSEKIMSGRVAGLSMNASQPESGQLTAGEINDLDKWDEWLKALKSADNKKIQEEWEFQLEEKIEIHVKNAESIPLNNIKVALYNATNDLIMMSRTDYNGNVTLFKDSDPKNDSEFYTLQIIQENNVLGKKIPRSCSKMEFVVENQLHNSNNIDVMFTIDATGSMGDEISYLKSELKDIIGRLDNSIEQKRVALTFYRDHGDAYVVKDFDFTDNIEDARVFLAEQSAGGGGDYEEAVEEALKISMSKSWQMDSKSKLLFLLLDAPPHYNQENVDIIKNQIKIAQEKGIKIIQIVASGANKNVEFLMRYFSVSTNGTYVFLTDDSGIGNPHINPTTDKFKVEKLNDLIVRLIEKYSGV